MKSIINKYKNYHPGKWEALTYLLIPIFIGMLTATCSGGDIWFIVSLGRQIINKGFPSIDPFTIHQGLHVVIQQWIPDVIYYKAFDLFGKMGIYTVVNILNCYFIFITYKLLMLITDKRRNQSILFTLIITMLFSLQFVSSRPQMFSYPLLMTELYVLEKYFKTNNWKNLIPLPIISLLLINCHASMWLLQFCFLLPFILNTFKYSFGKIVSEKREKKYLLIFGLLMFIVGFVNPYGYKCMTYVLTSYGVPEINDFISEMIAVNIHTALGKIIYVIILLIVMYYILSKKIKKIDSRYIFLFLGSLYLALSSYRSYIFIILSSIYPIAIYEKENFYIIKDKVDKKYILLFIFSSVCLVLIPYTIIVKNKFYIMNAEYKKGIDYLYKIEKDNIENVRLYCDYGICNYNEWLGIKAYIDSRAEIFLKANNKKADIFIENYNLQKGKIYYKDFLNKYDFNYLFVRKSEYLYPLLLHDDDYEIKYIDKTEKINYKYGVGKEEPIEYILFKKKENN